VTTKIEERIALVELCVSCNNDGTAFCEGSSFLDQADIITRLQGMNFRRARTLGFCFCYLVEGVSSNSLML
jgi:hypothetical protein